MQTLVSLLSSAKKSLVFPGVVSVLAIIASTSTIGLANTTAVHKIAKSVHCPPFAESTLTRDTSNTKTVNPSNWIQHIENARDGEEILLQDGLYPLEQYAVVINNSITLRSASGINERVVIEGRGYGENAEALMIMADDVHIADITIKNTRDHGITIQEGFARSVIYNVNLVDIGTQHIKGNRPGPNGIIACSQLGYTTPVSTGDYNSAIDLHAAVEWNIRDNYLFNIYGDGSGCVVDADCGSMWPGGEPAILLWRNSKDNTVERNTIIDSYRAIALGLNTPYSGGVVKDNFICRSDTGKQGINGFIAGDAGISLSGADNVTVTGNRISLAGDYRGEIEITDGSGIVVSNNMMSKPVWDRGNAEFTETENKIDATFSYPSCTAPEALLMVAVAEELTENKIHKSRLAALTTDQIPGQTQEDPSPVAPPTGTAEYVVPVNTANNTEDAIAHRTLLLDIREERLLAMEERLLATEERLKAKEERMLFLEQQQILDARLANFEQLLRTFELQFNQLQEVSQPPVNPQSHGSDH